MKQTNKKWLILGAGTFAAGCKFGGKATTLIRADELQTDTEQPHPTQKGIFIINHKKWIH